MPKRRVTVNFLCSTWLLRRMAYNESTKERMILSIVLTKAKENPLTELQLRKGVFFLVLTAREPSVKPLADVVRCYICCDRQYKRKNTFHFSHLPSRIKWAGKAAKPLYHTFRQKDTGDAKRRVTVNFLRTAWLLGRIAYNKSSKRKKQYVIASPKRKDPLPELHSPKGGPF